MTASWDPRSFMGPLSRLEYLVSILSHNCPIPYPQDVQKMVIL